MLSFTDQENAGIYSFLKVVLSTEPSTELLKFLQMPKVFECFESTGVALEKKELAKSQLTILQEDYIQLFVGPRKHISLNEAIYTEGIPQFWGEETVKINKLISYLNLELDKNWVKMPDHITVEFEIMQKLLEAKIEANNNNDNKTVQKCSKAISHLFNEHIIKWVPKVCTQIVERAQTNVYKAIGTLTQDFIQYSYS